MKNNINRLLVYLRKFGTVDMLTGTDVTIIEIEIAFLTENRIELKS